MDLLLHQLFFHILQIHAPNTLLILLQRRMNDINAGKSSLINAITTQKVAIVSEFKGTTTDPVFKAMELLPLGPVMIIDTPGIDDEGELGLLLGPL